MQRPRSRQQPTGTAAGAPGPATGSVTAPAACNRSQDGAAVTCSPQHVAGGRGTNQPILPSMLCRASCNVGGLRFCPSPPPHWRQHLQCPDRPHAPSPRSSDQELRWARNWSGSKPAGPVVPPRIGRGRRTFQSEFRALRTAAALGWSGLACSQSWSLLLLGGKLAVWLVSRRSISGHAALLLRPCLPVGSVVVLELGRELR